MMLPSARKRPLHVPTNRNQWLKDAENPPAEGELWEVIEEDNDGDTEPDRSGDSSPTTQD